MSDRREFLKLTAATLATIAISKSAHAESPHLDLEEITIAELQSGLQSGKWTSASLTRAYLDRIAALDKSGPKLNSIIELNPDAESIAAQADADRKSGKVRGPLHGIPVLIKDNISTADRMQTTAGSLALIGAGAPNNKDAFMAAQLRRAGAVLLGKTNLSEWANFRSGHSTSAWSGRGGQTHNPYALDRNPSGSSSGTGAAVSGNLCAVGIGTETDGSIVSPSCSNGLVGIKPTVGLVSRAGIIPISHTQDTAGPMARCVADAAALLAVIAGADPDDAATSASAGHISPDYTKFTDPNGLRGLRIGVVAKFAKATAEVDKLFQESVAAMKSAGAEIIDNLDFATQGKFDEAENVVLQCEFKADLNKYLAALGPQAKVRTLADVIAFNDAHAATEMPYFGQEEMIKSQARPGLDSDEYKKALADCRRLSRDEGIDAMLRKDRLDVLIGITGTPAWFTDWVNGDAFGFSDSSLAAVAGYPHITVPMGYIFGLPVGISFIGAAWSEPTLIKAAYAYEQATKHRRAPKFLPTVQFS
ncbi:MAG TPA: amidase [Candidatus Koribacter sp.]|jgi:amidase